MPRAAITSRAEIGERINIPYFDVGQTVSFRSCERGRLINLILSMTAMLMNEKPNRRVVARGREVTLEDFEDLQWHKPMQFL